MQTVAAGDGSEIPASDGHDPNASRAADQSTFPSCRRTYAHTEGDPGPAGIEKIDRSFLSTEKPAAREGKFDTAEGNHASLSRSVLGGQLKTRH